MGTDRILRHRSLTNQKLPAAMQHQAGLLRFRLRRHKSVLADHYRATGVHSVNLKNRLRYTENVMRCRWLIGRSKRTYAPH
jgi:hypothetical protein